VFRTTGVAFRAEPCNETGGSTHSLSEALERARVVRSFAN
jgi:hypothetical protein